MNNKIALGAMLFGSESNARGVDKKTAFDLLDCYVDGGGSVIDTANSYSYWSSHDGFGGQSETVIGHWLSARPGMRDRVQIATKVGCEPLIKGGYRDHAEGLSPAVIAGAIEASLTRLQTDHVDLYWAHKEDRATDLTGTVSAFGKVVADGKALRLGVSNHALWRVERARGIARQTGVTGWTALQLSDSYLRVRPFTRPAAENHRFGRVTDEVTDYVLTHNEMELWAYSPLLGGAYDRSDRAFDEVFQHPGSDRRLAALTEVAAEWGITRSQAVLAWLAGGDLPRVPIVGVSSIQQVLDALAAVQIELSADQRARLDAAH